MKIFSFFNFRELNKCFFWGYAQQQSSLLTATLKGEKELKIVLGRSDVELSNFEFFERNAVYFSTGSFYGFIDGIFDEINLERGDGRGTTGKRAQPVPWRDLDGEAVALFLREPYSITRLEYFKKSNQLFALSLMFFYLYQKGVFDEGNLSNHYLAEIGEAIRKSSLAAVGAPVLNKLAAPQHSDHNYGRVFDLICDGLGHNEDSYDLCVKSLQSIGETYWYHTNIGHYYFGKKDRQAADSHYVMAARLLEDCKVRNIHFNNGVFTWRPLNFCKNIVEVFEICPGNFARRGQKHGVRAIHLVGCDSIYFEKYGNLIIGSSVRNGPEDILVYVVIVNPSEKSLSTLDAWSSRRDCHVKYTIMESSRTSKPYYTCLRFIKAPDILESYDLPVFITDVDMAVQMNWDIVIRQVQHADIGYVRRSPDREFVDFVEPGMRPWDVAANTIFINNTDAGVKFARFVAEYVKNVLRFPPQEEWYRFWGIDQVALRQGIDTIISPAFARGINLGKVPFVARPRMHIGGKERLLKEATSFEPETFEL